MRRAPIAVVAVIFVLELAVLVFGTPVPSPSAVRSESLSMTQDNSGLVLVIDRPAAKKPEGTPGPDEPAEDEGDILKAASEETPSGREVIEIEFQADTWRLRKPIEFPASGSDVDRIIGDLRSLHLTEVPSDSAATHKDLQLDDEQAIRVTVNKDGRALLDILVGETDDRGRTFIRKHGEDAIWMVEGLRRDDLARSLDELRDKQIFDVESGDVTALSVERGREQRSFVKDGEKWRLEPADESWLPDPSKVGGAVNSAARLRAIGFADDAGVDTTGLGGLFATAAVTFTVQPEGKTATTHKLLVGNKDASGDNYYVAKAGQEGLSAIFTVSKHTIERIIGGEETGLDEYREHRVVRDVTADKVKSVTVAIGGATLTFEKGEGADEWKPAAGSPFAQADGSTISAAVRKLVSLRAEDFIAVPGLRMGDRPVTLKGLIDDFPRDILSSMDGATQGSSTDALEIANIVTQNLVFLEQMAGLYAVIYPESAPGAAGAFRALAGQLRGTFTALRDPLLTLADRLAVPVQGVPVAWTLGLEDGKTITVRIGGKTPDGKRPVGTNAPGDSQVYAVAADALGDAAIEDVNDLRTPAVLPDVPADRVTAATFADSTRTWRFARAIGGAWTQAPRTSVPDFDADKLASAIGRVLEMSAVKFVRTTADAAGLVTPAATVQLVWEPQAPAAAEGEPAPPPPAPRTVTIRIGAADAEGQRHVNVSGDGVDGLLAAGIFTVGSAAAGDLMIDASDISKAEAGPAVTPGTATPTEGLQNLVGGGAPPSVAAQE